MWYVIFSKRECLFSTFTWDFFVSISFSLVLLILKVDGNTTVRKYTQELFSKIFLLIYHNG